MNDLINHTLLGTKNISNGTFTNVHYKISNEPSHFVVNLNGTPFNNTSALVTTSFENNTIVIDAQDNSGSNNVVLVIDNSTAVGTYNIGSACSSTTVKGQYNVNGTNLVAQSGSITITSKTSNQITGTFNFITNGSNNFTQGSFDLEY